MLPTPLHCTSICGGSGTGSGSEPEPVPEPEYIGGLSELNIYNKCWHKCWQLLANVGPTSVSEIRYSTSRLAEEMSPAASGPAGGEIFFLIKV